MTGYERCSGRQEVLIRTGGPRRIVAEKGMEENGGYHATVLKEKHEVCVKLAISLQKLMNNSKYNPRAVAYLGNSQGGTTPRGRTFLP